MNVMAFEKQLEALASFVDDWAVKTDQNVKGNFTSGDYVTWQLARIFGPMGWSFTILSGPEIITISEISAYVRVVGRLTVRFANGAEAHQDDIGIWPLRATKANEGGTLENTAAERYETVEKAARTDCLKNAAENLGTCFRPMTDLELAEAIKRKAYQAAAQPSKTAREATEELFGPDETEEKPKPPPPAAKRIPDAPSSPWHTRVDLVGKARQEIPYYNHPAHIIATLRMLETEKQVIVWGSSDETCLKMLQAYAKARADEKAGS